LVWDRGGGEEALRSGLAEAARGRVNPYELAHRILAGVRREMHDGQS
jgi:hypothetical protein